MREKLSVCVVGSSNIDLLVNVPRLPTPGETLRGQNFKMGFGGKGANQAVMAARLGAQVSVVTKLGRDTFGDQTLENYRAQGIDTRYVLRDEAVASGVALITVDANTGENSIVIASGANDTLTPADVQASADAIMNAQIVICQAEIPIESSLEAFKIASRGATFTMLNPAPAVDLSDELLGHTQFLILNEVEAEMLVRQPVMTEDDALNAAHLLQKRRAQGGLTVVITLGARGVLVLDTDGTHEIIRAQSVQAVDTTGAGDAFVGSFAYFLVAGKKTIEAARRAGAIATQTVLKRGTQTSFPTRDEVASLLNG